MKLILLPTNIFWIAGHIVMVAAGIFLTVIAAQSIHKDNRDGNLGFAVARRLGRTTEGWTFLHNSPHAHHRDRQQR
jgi:hypothetical protein